MRNLILILFFAAFSSITAIEKKGLDNYEIEIAEIGQSGTLVVRTWCYNKKPIITDDVFKECAVKGIMFKGINDSGRMKGRSALVPDGYENHKEYFDNFFQSGEYQKYVRVAMDGYVEQNNLVKVGKIYKVAKIVVISYNELRIKLEKDKIIKGLNNGF